jgi:CRISPR/Cas system-associated exonuclease Cas4 (RecB family)
MIRISQAGACPRRVELEAWGVEGEPLWEGSERAFAEGNLHETDILRWAIGNLPGAPYSLFGQQQEVYIWKDNKEILRGHIDGLAIPVAKRIENGEVTLDRETDDEIILLEAKTLANRGFQELREKGVKEAHPQYYTQVQLYLHALGLDKAYLVARNKETPKTRMWDHYYEEIQYDKDFVEAEIERLAELDRLIEEHIEIDPPYNPDTHWQCRRPWCPFTHICHPDWRKQEVQAVEREDLLDVITEYNEIGEQIKELEAKREELKQQLLATAEQQPVQAGSWLVQVVERRQERFDTKLARKELPPDILSKLLKVNTYKVLKVEEV